MERVDVWQCCRCIPVVVDVGNVGIGRLGEAEQNAQRVCGGCSVVMIGRCWSGRRGRGQETVGAGAGAVWPFGDRRRRSAPARPRLRLRPGQSFAAQFADVSERTRLAQLLHQRVARVCVKQPFRLPILSEGILSKAPTFHKPPLQ